MIKIFLKFKTRVKKYFLYFDNDFIIIIISDDEQFSIYSNIKKLKKNI
jgi:hypothetical protein